MREAALRSRCRLMARVVLSAARLGSRALQVHSEKMGGYNLPGAEKHNRHFRIYAYICKTIDNHAAYAIMVATQPQY